MKNLSFAYLVFSALSAAIAAFCFYSAWLMYAEAHEGVWLFAAMGLLFSILPAFALIKVLAGKSALFAHIDRTISPKAPENQGTRFGPHWMMLLGMIALALLAISLLASLVMALLG